MKFSQFMMFSGIALMMNAVCANSITAVSIPDYPAQQLSEHAWVIHGPTELPNPKNQGFMNNPGIVLTSAGVVIIDPGSSLQSGEMVLRVLKTLSDRPVVAVFNTHVHGDHWLGNQAVLAAYPGVKIYAHPKMIAEAKAGTADEWITLMQHMTQGATAGTVAVLPNAEVNDGDTIAIGDTHFRIYHNGWAHTKTDVMIEVVEQGLMFLGDNSTHQRIIRMSDGSFKGNLAAIDIALASKAKLFIPGHGPSGGSSVAQSYRDYLNGVYAAAKQAFDNNLDSSEVRAVAEKNTMAYRDWPGYDEEVGRHGVQAYAEIEAAEF